MTNETKTPSMSLPAAVSNLARFFSGNPDADSVTLEQIFNATGRDLAREKQNKSWLFNKLTSMKPYNLLIRKYATSKDGFEVLSGLSLTDAGKAALGRPLLTTTTTTRTNSISGTARIVSTVPDLDHVTPEVVYRYVKELRKQMPSFRIVFEIRPRDEEIIHGGNTYRNNSRLL